MRGRTEKETPRNRTPAAAHRKEFSTRKSSALDLIRALRWHPWPPEEAAALARRRSLAELRRRHLRAATAAYGRDRELCAWHVQRMCEIHRLGCRHV